MTSVRAIAASAALLILGGCAGVPPVQHIPFPSPASHPEPGATPKKFAIFFDGTANHEGSYTNVSRLYNLTTLQSDTAISTIYIAGVGTGFRPIGAMTGLGIGNDVRQAYRYLAENYSAARGDQIFIFGFSRGAYAARILTSLLHTAGVPDLAPIPRPRQGSYLRNIYHAYKRHAPLAARQAAVAAVTGTPPTSVTVDFLGLWDTVEALDVPDYTENDRPNPRYSDQLCNVRKAAQALSIDDDRAWSFTPLLLTRDYLVSECPGVRLDEVVEEVWFSGAHADVGGGYRDSSLNGVSLNWMLARIAPYGLVPRGSRVYGDPLGKSHNPRSGVMKVVYHHKNRTLTMYHGRYNGGALKIHESVLDRLNSIPIAAHESHWYREDPYAVCFPGRHPVYVASAECSRVITIVPYDP